jgi:integrase
MSKKGQITTADPLPWDEAIRLIRELGKEGDYKYQLLVTCGVFFGLRIYDILHLKWSDLLGKKETVVIEHKTKKRREITITDEVQQIITNAFLETNPSRDDYMIQGLRGEPLTKQAINRKLKRLKKRYGLNIKRISTHTLRKTFGTTLWEKSDKSYEVLLLLMNVYNHSSLAQTMRYLGITQEKIKDVYTSLTFN